MALTRYVCFVVVHVLYAIVTMSMCPAELCEFLTTLDTRYQEKIKKEGVLVAKKI